MNMLYAGLKFTGLALNVAGDLAKSMRQDSERMLKDIEAEAAAKVQSLTLRSNLTCLPSMHRIWRATRIQDSLCYYHFLLLLVVGFCMMPDE